MWSQRQAAEGGSLPACVCVAPVCSHCCVCSETLGVCWGEAALSWIIVADGPPCAQSFALHRTSCPHGGGPLYIRRRSRLTFWVRESHRSI